MQRKFRDIPDYELPPGSEEHDVRVLELDLTTARDFAQVGAGIFDMLVVDEITDVNANVKIKFDRNSAQAIPVDAKDQFDFLLSVMFPGKHYFNRLFLYNDAVTAGIVRLYLTRGISVRKLLRVTADQITGGLLESAVTIGDTATPIPATPYSNRLGLSLYNNEALKTIYLGSSTVTVGNGHPLKAEAQLYLPIVQGVVFYGIVESGTADLRILEVK